MLLSFASEIQKQLEQIYALLPAPCVEQFIVICADDSRETLYLREAEDESLEIALHLPQRAIESGWESSLDEICQVVEGVSHFLFVVERARRNLPTTQLEMELQAEVDKFVLFWMGGVANRTQSELEVRSWRERLFHEAVFVHDSDTEEGERYRVANRLADRFSAKIETRWNQGRRLDDVHRTLRRFYDAGQADKIAMAIAA